MPKHTRIQANMVLVRLMDHDVRGEIIGSLAIKETSDHDIDVLIEQEVSLNILLNIFEPEYFESTDWGGIYFHNTEYGDIDFFFRRPE